MLSGWGCLMGLPPLDFSGETRLMLSIARLIHGGDANDQGS
jgi:hypothetical protein